MKSEQSRLKETTMCGIIKVVNLKSVDTRFCDAQSIHFNEGGALSALAMVRWVGQVPVTRSRALPRPLCLLLLALWFERHWRVKAGRREEDSAPDIRN